MKGITYTQVAQYCVLIFAFMVPAIFISIQMTGNPIPQIGMGSSVEDGTYLLDKLNGLSKELGFAQYTNGSKSKIDVFMITLALMVGTAGLPHVIVRFFTVKRVKDARKSAGIALLLIAILYTTAPAVAVFARTNMITTVSNQPYSEMPEWFKTWEKTGLISFNDKNGDGKLSKTEILEGYEEHFGKHLDEDELDNLFSSVDIDGSGFIDYSEFIMATMNEKKNVSEEKLKASFKTFDRDGNGTISPDEIKAVLGGSLGDDTVSDIINQVDDNKDGEI